MKKIRYSTIAIIAVLIFFQVCKSTIPTEKDIIGEWTSDEGAKLKFTINGKFEGRQLPAELFFGHAEEYTNKKINGKGRWTLKEGQGWWELSLNFKEILNKKHEFDTQILISGSGGFLERNPPWYLFEWKGEEEGARYILKKQ